MASSFPLTAKGRILAVLTATLFLVAMTGQGFALVPPDGHASQCRVQKMQRMQHVPGPAQHKCKHEAPKMPCCPMPATPNTVPAECQTEGQCCQISEDRTRERRDALASRANQSDEMPRDLAARAGNSTLVDATPRFHEVRLRHSRPVFELKADLRL